MSGITLRELRAEMARLTEVMMAKNALYLRREREIVEEFGHDPLKLTARLNDDMALSNASAVAKTCATLAGAMAAVIQSELAYEARYRRGRFGEKEPDNGVHIREGAWTGPHGKIWVAPTEPPITIRPQDLTPETRMIVFGDRGMQA